MTTELSDLIGRIYDTALEPDLWPEVLAEAARFLPGYAAALMIKGGADQSGLIHYDDGGIDPHYKQLYFDRYINFDPTLCGNFFADPDAPVAATDVVPYPVFTQTGFFRDWVEPQGLVDFLCAMIDKSPSGAAIFSIFRTKQQGMVDDGARERMRLLMPHIRRSVLIGRTIGYGISRAETLADTLDSVSSAVFLVGAGGRLVEANAAGHAMIAEGSVLRAGTGRLIAGEAAADRSLREAFSGAETGDAGLGTQAIAVTLVSQDGLSYIAHVLPLTSGARRSAGAGYAAVAAVFLRRVQLDGPAMPEVISKMYGLTPTELKVLLAVFEAAGINDIADALKVSPATVKTHLSRIFLKTGTKRQADLVKLVAGFAASTRLS
ncbi:transcriptional regulator [Terrihabitans soli]|uniref:Transcriptional regulator n=1 Tax=Terrihabitans soli TaxID=708113 RepID=A0A6S6QNP5_9HYPH|nr:helix-turn-helix transcriptional regulator [Terrihabitans soli]BCJ89537.1 transcriptional regulator [Terrihabitans soli]